MKIGSSMLMATAGCPCQSLQPAVVRANRWVTECLLSVVFAIGAVTFAATAQDSPPADGGDAVETVSWDLSDPVNHAESREFFAGLWAAEDAGLPAPDFEFTNTPPGLMLSMLIPEFEVFTELYAHRLQLDFDAGERYLVTDLIADDAEVRTEFRSFVLTGKLAPRPEVDSEAHLAHYALSIDAITVQERATVVSVHAVGGLIESQGMSVNVATDAETGTSPVPDQSTPAAEETRCRLRWLAEWSRLKCMYNALYERDKKWPAPDFDCDDFADAMLRYLLRHLEGWNGKIGVILWRCSDGTSNGHAVPVLIDPEGRYWWIEPRSGTVYGPFATASAALASIRAENDAAQHCRSSDLDELRELGPWNLSGWYGEQDPWHQSVRQRNRFCAKLAACCRDYVSLEDNHCPPPPGVPSGPLSNCHIGDYFPLDLPPTLPPLPATDWPPPCSPPAR
jgi:hypothetical protein